MELLRGTLDLLILYALTVRPMHGYELGRWLESTTESTLNIEEGSLYPALKRMTRRGWIEGEWGRTDRNRRIKVYRLTDAGREEQRSQAHRWGRFVRAVGQVATAAEA